MKKNLNKTLFIFLILLIFLRFMPYKLPIGFKGKDVALKIRHHEWTGGPEVRSGKKAIDKYISSHNITNATNECVTITGKTPYEELTTFKLGIPKYLNFTIYGNFTGEVRDGELVFNVTRWYPSYWYVALGDTYFWDKIYKFRLYGIALCIILIVINFFKRK